MLNELLGRLRAAAKAFRRPEMVRENLLTDDVLVRLAYGPDIAVVDAQWVNGHLLERIRLLPPKESDAVRRYIDGY